MNPILITGATGRVGRQVVSQLQAAGTSIRAMSRHPESAGLPPGTEVVRGDLTMPGTLDACLDGVDAVFLVWTAPRPAVQPAIERIAKYARRIVLLSSPYQTAHPLFQQPNPLALLHAEIERQIMESGLLWTFLRPGMFSANARLWWAPQILTGDVVRWPYALAPTAPIDERDIAAIAVHALHNDNTIGRDFVLTGPQSLTQAEQVSIIGEVLGRSLRFEELSPEEARRELSDGFGGGAINMLLDAWQAAVGQPALVTNTVAELTGTPPHTFREWAVANASHFRSSHS